MQPISLIPVGASERIHILDILRGFALAGILLVNIAGFASPAFLPGYLPGDSLPWYDSLADFTILYLADGKFFTIFSFLFGLGFAVQMTRAEARGRSLLSFYPRRLLVLFLFGLLHASLFWVEDILRLYALLGFALLAFRRLSNRALLGWALFFLALGYALSLLHDPLQAWLPDLAAPGAAIYRAGTFLDVVSFQTRWGIFIFLQEAQTQAASVLALFLLGLLAGRLRFFEDLSAHRALLWRVLGLGLPAGLLLNLLDYWLEPAWLGNLAFILAALCLSAAYVSALSLFSLTERGARWLAPLGQAGRMALTNYFLQSVVCSVLFNGYGLGWYEKIGSAGQIGLTALLYVLQVIFSVWWMRYFHYGPLEWLWRALTYLQKPPFLRTEQIPPSRLLNP